ncbi:serine hydrolase domain-containing protein [Leucobacter chironomi]|uniref:serine hydrolase domain-containing protein n=1 Tax=Leucobacter chironomi TaxID=491918 RepID=UPI00196A1CC0|nr:serine hydrolase domain-containing protein [Leucobacter chironomi]
MGSGLLALVLIGAGALAVMNRPLSRAEVDRSIEAQLRAAVESDAGLSSALLTIYSADDDRLMQYAVGSERPGSPEPAGVDSRYHSASVGKTMLATVYGQLVDEGVVDFDDPAANWLDDGELAGLFTVDGVDHAAGITLGQLLSHTSGVADYLAGPVVSGPTMLEEIAADPDRIYAPADLLAVSRERQQPIAPPGQAFSYSDTGYVLLGLALERIEGKPYAQILDDRIFAPLGMSDSEFMTEFGPGRGILALDVSGVDLSERGALSADWAGGGVVTTMHDLLRFTRAFEQGDLLSAPTRAELTRFEQEIEPGIRYGKGIMQFRFSELSPLLFSMSDVRGAVGATGSFALYDPSSDTYYIANFGAMGYDQEAIEQLVDARLLVDRLAE